MKHRNWESKHGRVVTCTKCTAVAEEEKSDGY